jgi:hypothetical protein
MRRDSKITPVEEEVRTLYLSGKTFKQIAYTFTHLGITEGMVAGYVFRAQLKRTHSEAVEKKLDKFRQTKVNTESEKSPNTESEKSYNVISSPKVLPERTERVYDVLSWDGKMVARKVPAARIRAFIPHMTEDKFNYLFEKDRQVVSTSYSVVLNQT